MRIRHLLVVAVAAGGLALATTTPAGAAVPGAWITEQVQFVVDHQLADGAILGPGNSINPYFANIAAMGLARANTSTGDTALHAWMSWDLAHLNGTDVHGLHGTIYDYGYDPGSGNETSTGGYDSVDSYASTTLNVAYLAYRTGDANLRSLVSGSILTYEAIANLLDYSAPDGVRQADGLTAAVPGGAEYTMDNAEVYSGLSDFASLESLLGRSSQASYYGGWAASTASAMSSLLWNGTNGNWDWALGAASNPAATFYPDAAAQLWPETFGAVAPTSGQATAAWSAFTSGWPDWMHDGEPDAFPWTAMAVAAQVMGDGADADTLLTTIHSNFAPGWGGNWYDDEAGWFLMGATGTTP